MKGESASASSPPAVCGARLQNGNPQGANDMDGVVGLTQCAIPPSANFTYRFRIQESQSGTFWYHAHSGVRRADGLYGGLVVHEPSHGRAAAAAPDPSTRRYDSERLLLVGDWYHRPASEVLAWFEDPDHYAYEVRPSPYPPPALAC